MRDSDTREQESGSDAKATQSAMMPLLISSNYYLSVLSFPRIGAIGAVCAERKKIPI
jgi:hypothetical protein